MAPRPLHTLADIYPGHPFRGSPVSDANGDTFVVQFRHVTPGQAIDTAEGHGLDRTVLTGRKAPNYLQPGDVLFMARGTRNDAAVVDAVPPATVCTPNFFLIRPRPETKELLPAFLAWQLNHRLAQRFFASCNQGTAAPSIAKAQLSATPIYLPPLKTQLTLVGLSQAVFAEREHLLHLIANRQKQLDLIGDDALLAAETH